MELAVLGGTAVWNSRYLAAQPSGTHGTWWYSRLELAVLGGVDERVDAAVGERQHDTEVVQVKRYCVPYTFEECRRSAHLPFFGSEPVGGQTTKVCDAWPDLRLPPQPQSVTEVVQPAGEVDKVLDVVDEEDDLVEAPAHNESTADYQGKFRS